MRIATNASSEAMLRQIQALSSDQAKLQLQVGTGRRISDPADDPAAVGRVLTLQAERSRATQYSENATRALTLTQSSYSALKSLKQISDRASEIATLGVSTAGADARAAYAAEIDQLLEQALQYANTRSGNDFIFAGTAFKAGPAQDTPFVATRTGTKISSVAYGTDPAYAESFTVRLSDATEVSPLTSGTTNQGFATFLNSMIELRDALSADNTAGISNAQTTLVAGEDLLITAMAEMGGMQSRIEAAKSQHSQHLAEVESLISDEASVDLPTTIVKLTQTQTAYQAALASTTKIMNLSLLDYIQ
jgi:flagellar hook-associated protein 3 FlgL